MRRDAKPFAPEQNTSFRKVVVTGGLGFVGARVASRLASMENVEELVIFDRVTYAADFRRLGYPFSGKSLPILRGDIRSVSDVSRALEGSDAVIHLAAETHVPRSIVNPELFFDVNVVGTETLLNAARDLGVKKFIHVSTHQVYGSGRGALKETAPLRPETPYATSKAMAEEAVIQAAQTGLNATILRPVTTVGAGQHSEKRIPRLVIEALRRQRLSLEADGRTERSYLPVGDLSAAICQLLCLPSSENLSVYNLGGEERLSDLRVAKRIYDLAGARTGLRFVKEQGSGEPAACLNDKAIRALGYRQNGFFDEELRALYGAYLSRADRLLQAS
ncbi:NAD-dependent epimerase/dehydratase family protein [uncultured Roseibium sp.]|uniref:NAD-dependent epimerase/dehydratase family protein n=1 Tax=uncultured Roseibium sp. TaxID=1936171 RepID=UPI00261A2CA1|nr:NAD-dependent epimerase/dehydratase family protein [uncultured Roseibium sp.]